MICFKRIGYYLSLLLFIALSALPSRATDIVIGTGTSTTTSYPYHYNWGGTKTQLIVTAAELNSAGYTTPSLISSLAFYHTSTGTVNLQNFSIKCKNTTASVFATTSFDLTGLLQVFNGSFLPSSQGTAAGWKTITFTTPFLWDGTSNLLLEVAWTNNNGGSNGSNTVRYTATGANYLCLYDNEDGIASIAGFPTTGSQTTSRPNMTLGITAAIIPYITLNTNNLNFNFIDQGLISATQTFTISGNNFDPASGNFTLTPPVGFQVSIDGNTWVSNPNTLSVPYVGNPIESPISVQARFLPTELQAYNGNLTISGGGANSNIALSGTSILTYCTSNATSTDDQDIGNITISSGTTEILNNGLATPLYSNTTANKTYSDYTSTVPPIQLAGGSTYQISVSIVNLGAYAYSSSIKVYIDYNRNGVFDTPDELAFYVPVTGNGSELTNDTWTGSFTLPYTVSLNGNAQTRMRVVVDENEAAPSCGTYTWGETEDYTVQLIAPPPFVATNNYSPDFGYVAPGTQSTPQSLNLYAGDLSPATGNINISPSANYEVSLDGTSWSSTPVQVAYSNSGATITPNTFQVRFSSPLALALNCPGTVTISGANAATPWIVNCNADNMQTYLPSTVSATSTVDTIDIAKVTLANIAFGDANVTPITGRTEAINKYSDNRLAAPVIQLNAGSIYPFTVNTYTSGTALPICSLGVYIDYNADGDYADDGEIVSVMAIPVANNGVATGKFMVPVTATLNPTNNPRIRFVVSTGYPNYSSVTYVCGETEDYRVMINPALPMVYVSTATSQVGKNIVTAASINEKILQTIVTTNNSDTPLTLASITFNTNGTNQVEAIANAKVYSTGLSADFATTTQVGDAVVAPNGSMVFTPATPIALATGDNYFWLSYDVASTASVEAVLDAQLTGLILSDSPDNKITLAQAPDGVSLVSRSKFDGTFGSTTTFPTGWLNTIVLTGTYIPVWSCVTSGTYPTATPVSPSSMAKFNGFNASSNSVAILASPVFSMIGETYPSTIRLKMYRAAPTAEEDAGSTLQVYISPSATSVSEATLLQAINADNATSINTIYTIAPIGISGWNEYIYSIPAGFGATNYIVLKGTSDYNNNIFVDNISFDSDAAAFMAYSTHEVEILGDYPVASGSENNKVSAFSINTISSNSPLTLTNFKFTPEGVTNLADIQNAKLWSLGNSDVFNPASSVLLATSPTISAGQNSITLGTPLPLLEGVNYFVLTYDVATTATAGNYIDANADAFTLTRAASSIERVFTNGNPAGNHIIKQPLNGVYTIGGPVLPTRYYSNLLQAADDLMMLGASDNVEFAIAEDQTFTSDELPTFIQNLEYGAGAGTYTLTIYPSGAPRTITGNTAYTAPAVISFVGRDRVVIDGRVDKIGTENGLTIVNNAEGADICFATVIGSSSSYDVTLQNINFKGKPTTNSSSAFGLYMSSFGHSEFNIHNNDFSRISNGISINGKVGNVISNINITNNVFGNSNEADRLRRKGIMLYYADNININNNTFNGIGTTVSTLSLGSIAAIEFSDAVTNSRIVDNTFTNIINANTSVGAYGINLLTNTGTTGNSIIGNRISNINTATTSSSSTAYNAFGIRLVGGANTKVYHNTVVLSGANLGTNALTAPLLITSAITGADIRNNIFANTMTGGTTNNAYAVYVSSATTFANINYNNYYTTGTKFCYYTAARATLAAWKLAVTADVNSVNTPVTVLANNDLHLSGASALNRSLLCPALAEVTTDMDGITRRVGAPTQMGADEASATITIAEQPVTASNACFNTGQTTNVNLSAGTVNVSAFDDAIVRTVDPAGLKYQWVKNSTETLLGTGNTIIVPYTVIPATADSYQSTVYGLFDEVLFSPTTVILNQGPSLFTLTGTGTLCPNATTGVQFTLSGSEAGFSYQLFKGTEAIGSPIIGTGSAITFDNVTAIGTYTVVATSTNSCSVTMTGTASISSLPVATAYNVTGGGTYCTNEPTTFAIGVDDSEVGVEYILLQDGNSITSTPVQGTGEAISFGPFSEAGTYTVVGILGDCDTEMTGSAIIIVNDSPTPYNLVNAEEGQELFLTVCTDQLPVTIGLDGSQLDISYQLFKDGQVYGDAIVGSGTEFLFPELTLSGVYVVIASGNGCNTNMVGLCSLIVVPSPMQYNMTGVGSICDNSNETVTIGLDDSQIGATYQLYRDELVAPIPVGEVVTGTGEAITFGNFNLAGIYFAKATLGTCTSDMLGLSEVLVNPAPTAYTINYEQQTGIININTCSNQLPIQFGITNSETDVSYQLYQDGSPLFEPIIGSGSMLMFPEISANGIYTVIGTRNDCSTNMIGSLTLNIAPAPQLFDVTGGGAICDGSQVSIPIGLSGSVVGTTYQLYRETPVALIPVAIGNPMPGTGQALSYGSFNIAGTYTVVATLGNCQEDMSGSAIISITNSPIAYTLTGGGELCNDGRGLMVGVTNSELDVTYNLFRNSIPYGTPVIGTGDAISFGFINTSGTFTVTADRSGCTTNMTGSVNIIIKPNPTNYDVLVNGNNVNEKSLCQGELLSLGLFDTEQGVTYTLFINAEATTNVLTGSGSAMSFASIVSPISGVYQIFANKDNCIKQIDNDIDVIVNPLPQLFTVSGGANICAGDNLVQIALSGSEIGVNYQLFRNQIAVGQPIAGTGEALILATDNFAGLFTAVADKDGCLLDMSGSAEIIVRPIPQKYTVTSTGSTNCSSTGIDVLLTDSEIGTTYTLLFNGNAIDNPLVGTGEQMSFGIHSAEGIYTISANRDACIAMMDGQINLRIDDPPMAYNVSGGGMICIGDNGLRITLSSSELGVSYQVKLNNQNIGEPVIATGEVMVFGPFNQAGTYTIIGSAEGCETVMNGSAVITTSPKPVVQITGPNEIVQVTTGSYSANAEVGMNYYWSVTGGSIVGSNSLATVNILWGTAGNGTLTLTKTNAQTLCANTADYNVTILNVAVPSIQAFGIIFSSVTQNSMMLRWTRGNGNRVLVVATEANSFSANPQVGVSYTANANYGQGTAIGNGFVVYNGTGRYFTVANLDPGTVYKFKVYEFFQADNAYNVTDAILNPRTKTTAIAAPINLEAVEVDVNEALVSWTYAGNSDFFEIQLSYNANFTNIVPGYENSDFGNVNEAVLEDLTGNTDYFVRVRAQLGSTVSPWSAVVPFKTLMPEPTTAPSNLVVSNRTLNSFQVDWTAGNGDYSIVLASIDPILTEPSDRITYIANNDFSSVLSSLIGTAKVVYAGANTNFVLTGLNEETDYNLSVFTFNGEGGAVNYNPTPATAIGSTLDEEPTLPPSNLLFTNRTATSLSLDWDNGNSERFMLLSNDVDDFTAPIDGTTYLESDNLGNALIIAIGPLSDFINSGLLADTRYYYQVYGFNGNAGTENYLQVGLANNAKTLAATPANPSDLQVVNRTTNSMNLTWDAVTADNYILLASTAPITALPANAITYIGNADYTLANSLSDAKIVYTGNEVNAQVIGLNPETHYYFTLYTYNGTNTSEIYSTNFVSVNAFTYATEPTAPTLAEITNITANSMNLDWTNGTSTNNIVLMNTTNDFTAPSDGQVYTAGQTIGTAQVISVGTDKPVLKNGLTDNTNYYFAIYTFSGINDNQNYNLTPALVNDITLPSEPTPVSNLIVNNRTANTISLAWTKGNGTNTIVLAYTNPTAVPAPIDGTNYTADANYAGFGTLIDGAKVIYKGNGTTAEVTGLLANTNYHFAAFAFNGDNAKTNFNTIAATATAMTLMAEPLTAPSNIEFAGTNRTQMSLNWANGSGTSNIVLMNTTNTFIAPTDGDSYIVGNEIGTARVMYVGANNTLDLTGLTEATTYYFRVFTFNGDNGDENYLTANFAEGNNRTRSAATKLNFKTTPASIASGQTFSVTVEVLDDMDYPATPEGVINITLSETGTGSLYGTLNGTLSPAAPEFTFTNISYNVGAGETVLPIVVSDGTSGLTDATANIGLSVSAPSIQDRVILFGGVTANSMNLVWTLGNGTNRIVVMKAGSAVDFIPQANTSYPVSPIGIGVNSNNYVIYNNTGNTCPSPVLNAGTTYHFRVYGYNQSGTSIAYNTLPGSFNPRNKTTLLTKDDVIPADELNENDINNNTFNISAINPNPVVNQINFRMTNYESMPMTFAVYDASGREIAVLINDQMQTKGNHDFSFNLDNNLSSGTYLLVITAGDQTAVQSFVIVK